MVLVWATGVWPAQARWEYPEPLHTADDFEIATQRAWGAATSQFPDPGLAQRIMAQALAWARANPGAVPPSRRALALQEDGDIALGAKAWDHAEASFREALTGLDASNPPGPARLYQVLRRVVEMSWYNGHPAVDMAKRLSALSAAVLERDLMLTMGAPDIRYGEVDGLQRSAQEPIDMAFRPMRTGLDTIIATLMDVPGAKRELAEAVMTRQAVVQDVSAGLHARLYQEENHPPVLPDALVAYFGAFPRDPPGGKLPPLDRLRVNAAAMSMLAYADPHIAPTRLPRPLQLQHERTDLERYIANSLQNEWQAIPPEKIWKAVPDNAVVLEYAVYERPSTAHAAPGEPRYLVAAFSSKGVLKVVDIGSLAHINALVGAACRAILRDAEESTQCTGQKPPDTDGTLTIKAVGHELSAALLGPVTDAVAGATHLIVVPDGALQFFPFEMLTDNDGKYLITTHLVSYVLSPREIPLWQTHAPPSHAPPVIIGDPDYGSGGLPKLDDCSASARGVHRALRADDELDGFSRLCGAADEASSIKQILPDATLLTRSDATEEAVKRLYAPRILHIATHGFVVGRLDWPKSWVGSGGIWWDLLDYQVMDHDALLRSGLVFAGSNARRSPGGHDDGILSAREATLLNLYGTQLVVLSACDSGLGVARAGDGVIGLRRAFALAGARAQTFSLWPVGDYTTAEFMRRYYTLLAAGRPNVEALAQVKRAFIQKGPLWSEPWVWAVFVGYGYPGALGQ
jgi:CHAT domain-containing protein